MKQTLLLLFSCCMATSGFAQTDSTNQITVLVNGTDSLVFQKVDVEATFPGGLNGWRTYLMQNMKMDRIMAAIPKKTKHWEQQAIVQFIVAKDGSISDIKVINEVTREVAKEAKRIIAASPAWQPAMQNGRAVKAYRKQPITFVVDSD